MLSSDIIKLDWAANIIRYYKKIVTFFKQSHAGGALLQQEIVENIVKGGGLKSYIATRWATAFDCTSSIIRCKDILKKVIILFLIILNLIIL